eukprot:1159190-Pelagomonas_calceolata.AAC.4
MRAVKSQSPSTAAHLVAISGKCDSSDSHQVQIHGVVLCRQAADGFSGPDALCLPLGRKCHWLIFKQCFAWNEHDDDDDDGGGDDGDHDHKDDHLPPFSP